TYGGKPVRSLAHRSQVFGVVTEAHGLPPKMSVRDMILYWGGIHGVPSIEMARLSQELGVASFWEKRFDKLSTGMCRRAEIVLALLPRPKVVVLDEPFNGLDMDGVQVVRNLVQRLRDSGKVVVISTHTLNELDFLADRSVVVHQGKLVELEFTRGELGASEAAYQRLQEGK
ncbi:ATP-binding cassette domain-containing protein, partial [Mobiluncus mulieris]